jgi:4-amino-4-deoxy-L-arabinose transferase-like glycosyltransferase
MTDRPQDPTRDENAEPKSDGSDIPSKGSSSEGGEAPSGGGGKKKKGKKAEQKAEQKAEPKAEQKVEPKADPDDSETDGEHAEGEDAPATEAGAKEAVEPVATKTEARTPRGPHVVRGSVIFVLASVALFCLMAMEHQISRGPLYGIFLTLIAGLGLVDALGLLSGKADAVSPISEAIADWKTTWIAPQAGEPMFIAPMVALPVALLVAVVGTILVSWEQLPYLLAFALALLLPAALRRPSLLVFTVASLVMLPMLGAYGLYDPWETHYGEVAREILSRDDWISLWWAHEEWFFSKPIFIFWIEALSMGAMGVDFHPHAHPLHPEWAVRFPIYLLSVTALLCIYHLVKRTHGQRTAAITALVVCTLPHFFMLSHQSITDMPFVSTMTMAMTMLGLAVVHRPEHQVRRYQLGPFVVSVQTLVALAITMVVLPQILYLVSRNCTLVEGGFAWHHDRFLFGSAGNAGNPGHPEAREMTPVFDGIAAQPIVQGLLYAAGLGAVLTWVRRDRSARGLAIFAFYFFCALSFMAKGIPGFAIPGLVAMLFLIGSRRWTLLTEGHLRVGAGILTVLIVGAPWYVAMYIRHGTAFTDRLLVHDHLNRLTAGVHGDNASVEYFLEQLGYGLFPWIALAPLAVGFWIAAASQRAKKDASSESHESAPAITDALEATATRDLLMVVGLWGTAAFVLFSAMTTKFHHYIFPAVPAAGILFGLAFAPMFGAHAGPRWRQTLGTLLAVLAPVALVIGIGSQWGDPRGVSPGHDSIASSWVPDHAWAFSQSMALVLLGSGLLVGAYFLLGKDQSVEGHKPRPATALALFAAPAIVGLVGRDLAWATETHPWGFERLIHLFCYNYARPWPEQFDYRPILSGFAVVATVVIGLAAISQIRAVASRAFFGTALLFSVWCLDVYLIDLAPHWGQREILFAYYDDRIADEPIIGWQLNWKGENFYTNGAVYIFEDLDTRELERWVAQHPGERVYFVMEHARLGSLRSLLRGAEITPLTDTRLDNKFMTCRVILPGVVGSATPAGDAPARPATGVVPGAIVPGRVVPPSGEELSPAERERALTPLPSPEGSGPIPSEGIPN